MMKIPLQHLQSTLLPVPPLDHGNAENNRKASVLIPLIPNSHDIDVLFVKRSQNTPTHKGQVAFPGGGVSPQDQTYVQTALRELYEETHIPRDAVEILGSLPPGYTIEGSKLVIPLVGLIRKPVTPVPDGYEIFDVFTDTLGNLKHRSYQKRLMYLTGETVPLHFFKSKYTIWGLTANILLDLLNRLQI